MQRRTQRSPEADAYRHLYGTPRWKNLRARQLREHPLCARHLERGELVPANVCHHKNPKAKENQFTFFAGPFASLCSDCHDGAVQQIERIGYSTEIGADGWPIDRNHPAMR